MGVFKVWVMEIIEEFELYCCSVYCGLIGYFSCYGKMDISIMICILVVYQQQFYVWVGGGLVVDSEGVVEY